METSTKSVTGCLSQPASVLQEHEDSLSKQPRTTCSTLFQPRACTLDHDIARSYQDYYHGAFELDDIELGEHSLMRLGNVIVPNSSYGEIIEQVVMPALEDIYHSRLQETGLNGADAWIGFGSIHLVWELGKE